jgi:DNA replication and repair protein RecF
MALMDDRRDAVAAMSSAFTRIAEELGLGAEVAVSYRPRSKATAPEELVAELAERAAGDIERGFTGHGPHRDELFAAREGRELRVYGSQGQQRLGLLTLLLAERETIAASRNTPPLMLLDDVMSELDGSRRDALVRLLRSAPGQSLITTTDLDHVPGAREGGVERLAVEAGTIAQDALVA